MSVKWTNCGRLSIKKTLDETELKQGYGTTWIWTALDPDSRLIICALVGNRSLADCRKYMKILLSRIENKPLFVSDELSHYETVLRESFSTEVPVLPTGTRGRPAKWKMLLDDELDYAVVHKTRENGKVVKVERKIVFGDSKRIEQKLHRSIGNSVNTSCIERSNGTLRGLNSHLRRKSLTFAKEKDYFDAKIALIIYFYNFIRAHWTLSRNADKSYTERTPALWSGITDKVWKIEESFIKPYI